MGLQELWSTTAAENDIADPNINLREGMSPSAVNDSVRALMAAVKRYQRDTSGILVTSGTATAYTLATNEDFAALVDGLTVTARIHTVSGANPTLNVDSLGAKPIRIVYGTNVPTAALFAGAIYSFTYDADDAAWIVRGAAGAVWKYIGEVFDYAGSVAPALSLFCAGQAVSRTTYAALFAVIGTTFGAGDGSTTFNLPDLRGRVVAGKDDMGGTSANRLTNQPGGLNGDTLGATGGSETHTLTTAELPAHDHGAGTLTTNTTGAHTHGGGSATFTIGNAFVVTVADDAPGNDYQTSSAGAHSHTISGNTASTGSGGAHNNVQPTIILNKCIFAGA